MALNIEKKYNRDGKEISGVSVEYLSEECYEISETGEKEPKWPEPNDDVDEIGADKRYKFPNGEYKEDLELKKGTVISRYGNNRGRLTASVETTYEERGLPYAPDTIEYHEYEVIADGVVVSCIVTKSKIFPAFSTTIGGFQYEHKQSIAKEIAEGKLKEIFTWIDQKN